MFHLCLMQYTILSKISKYDKKKGVRTVGIELNPLLDAISRALRGIRVDVPPIQGGSSPQSQYTEVKVSDTVVEMLVRSVSCYISMLLYSSLYIQYDALAFRGASRRTAPFRQGRLQIYCIHEHGQQHAPSSTAIPQAEAHRRSGHR